MSAIFHYQYIIARFAAKAKFFCWGGAKGPHFGGFLRSGAAPPACGGRHELRSWVSASPKRAAPLPLPPYLIPLPKKKAPLGGLGSGQLRLTADVKQRPEQPGKQTRAAVNNDLHAVPLLFGK